MESNFEKTLSIFDKEKNYLYEKALEVVNTTEMVKARHKGEKYEVEVSRE